MSIGIHASTNKFAFLNVQDSSDEEEDQGIDVKEPNNRKKTKVAAATETTTKKKKRRRKKQASTSSDTVGSLSNTNEANQRGQIMQEWVQHDQNLVDDLYNEDLRRALELSRIEHEKLENLRTQMNNDVMRNLDDFGSHQHHYQNDDQAMAIDPPVIKKEKKKKTAKTISLEEFQRHVEDTLPLQKDVGDEKRSPEAASASSHDFFGEIDKQADNIKRIEEARGRFQERHDKKKSNQKQSAKTNKRDQQLQASEEKDQIIKKLQDKVVEFEEQFKHVKKRNKQLLTMLQQGEMKDKSELLLEIERLGVLRDELTDEVSQLNESLEQERSRSRKLKDELAKLQAKKSSEDHHAK